MPTGSVAICIRCGMDFSVAELNSDQRNRAIAIVNDDAKSAMGKAAATKLDEKAWLDESHQLCDTVA